MKLIVYDKFDIITNGTISEISGCLSLNTANSFQKDVKLSVQKKFRGMVSDDWFKITPVKWHLNSLGTPVFIGHMTKIKDNVIVSVQTRPNERTLFLMPAILLAMIIATKGKVVIALFFFILFYLVILSSFWYTMKTAKKDLIMVLNRL